MNFNDLCLKAVSKKQQTVNKMQWQLRKESYIEVQLRYKDNNVTNQLIFFRKKTHEKFRVFLR
jgi:hypothetical protein